MISKPIHIGGETFNLPFIKKKYMIWAVFCIAGIWLTTSALYTVGADEAGVIRRLGKYMRTTEPGLHTKIPFGLETIKKVKIQRVFKEEFGFRTINAGIRTEYSVKDYAGESLMLTGDLNSAVVDWIVQFRVKDPVKYLFNVRNVIETLRDASESVMREVVGDHSVDEVIVLSRQDIEVLAQQATQKLLDEFQTGIDIVTIKLQDVNPPKSVQPAFNEVNQARQEKERIINEALEAYNKVVPQAKGQAEQTIRQAEGYAVNRVNRAKGDAENFLAVWTAYNRAEDVTRRRLYLETLLDILPKLEKIYMLDEQQNGFIPLLQLQATEVTK